MRAFLPESGMNVAGFFPLKWLNRLNMSSFLRGSGAPGRDLGIDTRFVASLSFARRASLKPLIDYE